MTDIEKRVTACLVNIFPDLPAEQIPTASAATLEIWDSVAQVTLLALVAEDFGLELEFEDFEQLVSYQLIVDYVTRRLGAA